MTAKHRRGGNRSPERAVNDAIGAVVPPERAVMPVPDFEAVDRLHGHSHKPERAWRSFACIDRA
jgi:hypothetical protein